jgi:hypothetical protein
MLRAMRFFIHMAKTTKKKTKEPADKAPKKVIPAVPVPDGDDDKPFDFGGLPDRDLKKNLGCGS